MRGLRGTGVGCHAGAMIFHIYLIILIKNIVYNARRNAHT